MPTMSVRTFAVDDTGVEGPVSTERFIGLESHVVTDIVL